jgi:hypothetical protein
LRRCAVALVHYPVLDAQGAIVTTAVTNLDVHDLARSARTYGCTDYFVVHPIAAQRELVSRICEHWTQGPGGRRIPDRADALGLVRIVDSLDATYAALGGRDAVEMWATAARKLGPTLAFDAARARLAADDGKPVIVVFGTGWGLAPPVVEDADALLEPIAAMAGSYNHLSVRAACAIALDRLLGRR